MTTQFTTTAADDLRDNLQEAQEKLYEAIRLLEIYCRETNDRNAEVYLVAPLKIHAGRDHGYLSSDLNIDDLIDRLDETEMDDDLPDTIVKGEQTLYLLRNNLGPILNSFGEPTYVTIPTD